jgi:hypothetical protein
MKDERPSPHRKSGLTLQQLANETGLVFLVTPDVEQLCMPLTEAIARAGKPFAKIGTALGANIAGLISTISMPYTLADRSATDSHWQRIQTAQHILSLKIFADPGETASRLKLRREREAVAKATVEMTRFVQSPEGQNALIHDSLSFLKNLLDDEQVIRAANELILQGVVLCWGAFEAFVRDCFIAYVNAKPNSVLALIEHPVAKRRFELSKVTIETLAANDFNLSERMGTLLAQQQDLSDINSVKSVYQALFPNNKQLFNALSDLDLRALSHRRNLIVHKCGVVDETYAVEANCLENLGQRLTLSPDSLETHIGTAIRVAKGILDAVSTTN